MTFLTSLTSRQLIVLLTLASTAMIAGAWAFQLIGYAPCQMCFWQRNPHYVAMVIGVLALALRLTWMAWLGALALATTSAIGFYHTGVERQWWQGPASCTGSGVEGVSAEELLDQIMSAPLVRCDEIPWRISDLIPWELLDISMANLNALGSLVLALIWIVAARRA